jgi:sulfoacetaldehyde acetyltransferase
VIQVDVDHRVLGLTKKISLGIVGDAQAFTEALIATLRARHADRPRDDARIAEIAAEKAAWDEELASLSMRTGEPISPRRALKLVAEVLPRDAIVTTDIGNISSVANSYLTFDGPRQFLAAMMFGNCGYSYPTALGAKLGRPDRPVVAFVGDGAWGMSLAEVMTAVREDIPVVAIVWDNAEWGAEKKNQVDFYNDRYVGTNLVNPDFAAVARAMGADGYRVEREAEISDVVRTAIAKGRPAVIDVVVDPAELGDPFRRDALKKPVRLLDKYADLVG